MVLPTGLDTLVADELEQRLKVVYDRPRRVRAEHGFAEQLRLLRRQWLGDEWFGIGMLGVGHGHLGFGASYREAAAPALPVAAAGAVLPSPASTVTWKSRPSHRSAAGQWKVKM